MKALLVYSFFLTPIYAQSINSIAMPSAPVVSMPTTPTVSYPSTITLSDGFNENTTSTTSSSDTDSALNTLATSALQQIVGTTDTSSSTNAFSSTDLQSILTNELSDYSNLPLQNLLAPQSTQTNSNTNYGSILRCSINGIDTINSFRNYWISKPEKDGSFLFTGTYYKDNTTSDVFYMYFIPESSNNYTISLSTEKETDTFLSKLVAKTNDNTIIAKRTGNLIAIRQLSSDLNFDLLLSVDFELQQ